MHMTFLIVFVRVYFTVPGIRWSLHVDFVKLHQDYMIRDSQVIENCDLLYNLLQFISCMVFTLEEHNLFLNIYIKIVFLLYIMQYWLVWLTESHFSSAQKWLISCIQLWLESSALKWNFLSLVFAMLSLPWNDIAVPILLHWLIVVCLPLSLAIYILM